MPILIFDCGLDEGPDSISSHKPNSGLVSDCTTKCHSPESSMSPDPLTTNGRGTAGRHIAHVNDMGFDCAECHLNYTDNDTHMNGQLNTGNPAINIVNFDSTNPTGQWINDTGLQTGSCSSLDCHGTNIINWYGGGGTFTNCTTTCHLSGSLLSPDPLTTNGQAAAGKHITHVSDKGFDCQRCHFDYTDNNTHANGQLDTEDPDINIVNFDLANPNGQWINDTGPQTGNCSSLNCHGTDTLDWYGTGGWTLPACTYCHTLAIGTIRQVFGSGGDFDKESHHVIDYNNRNNEIVTQNDCLICHDMDNHMSGTVRLKNKDAAGQIIVYQTNNPASLEPFCLSCHDSDGATTEAVALKPFSSGNTLGTAPNIAGIKIKESWEKQYGHRREGLTCVGDGTAGTGCHGNYNSGTGDGSINAHGSDNKGLLTNKLTLPITSSTWDESRYKLCLDCHNNDPSVLTISELAGVAAGGNYAQSRPNYNQWPYTVDFMVSGFHDYYSYNMDRQFNLHLYHLIESMEGWYYRGGSTNGIPGCVTCHNVHGVDGQYYYLWDEWNFSIEYDSGTEYGKVADGDFTGKGYPEFCSGNCHWDGNYRYPRSPFNEAKATAGNTSGGVGLESGDTVTIYFSDSTNGPVIDETNIDTVLQLSGGHSWIDSDKGGQTGQLTAVWSDTDGKTDNVLIITIFIANSPSGDPDIAAGDSISFDVLTITDLNGAAIRGKMTIQGGF